MTEETQADRLADQMIDNLKHNVAAQKERSAAGRPACGQQCNACYSCPDLNVPERVTPMNEREEQIYANGFKDGEFFGKEIAKMHMDADRLALEAHWRR